MDAAALAVYTAHNETLACEGERMLLFSTIVELMGSVVCRMTPSINAAYQLLKQSIGVSVNSVDNKRNKIEPHVAT